MRRIQLELRACKDKLAEIPQDFFDSLYMAAVSGGVADHKILMERLICEWRSLMHRDIVAMAVSSTRWEIGESVDRKC